MTYPYHILHLDGLFFDESTDLDRHLQPLLTDLKGPKPGFSLDQVDMLIVTGDVTRNGAPAQFDRARIFVEQLMTALGIHNDHCLFLPGTHDVHWTRDMYDIEVLERVDIDALEPANIFVQDDRVFIRNPEAYRRRFQPFAENFYQPLKNRPCPFHLGEGFDSVLHRDRTIQLLGFNSCAYLDNAPFRRPNTLQPEIIDKALDQAITQHGESANASTPPPLRLAVCHHPPDGEEPIVLPQSVRALRSANTLAIFHGRVHGKTREDFASLLPERIYTVGAGCFGEPAVHAESRLRGYNLLEVKPDIEALEIHFREFHEENRAWSSWDVWPD
ncbi:MAG: hypothetical protein QNK37_02095 [Acidobacteriota bacterium]|nr:hypothetical protein [Acidobacteriota bacterium]